jgi:hypothetical protein
MIFSLYSSRVLRACGKRNRAVNRMISHDPIIQHIHAREVLDSRGNPTVEVEVQCAGGAFGRGQVLWHSRSAPRVEPPESARVLGAVRLDRRSRSAVSAEDKQAGLPRSSRRRRVETREESPGRPQRFVRRLFAVWHASRKAASCGSAFATSGALRFPSLPAALLRPLSR